MKARSQLTLYLMGSPQLRRGDKNVGIHRHKAMALLVYLAVTAQRHSRDALATLFWPNYSQSRARANLRRCISELKASLGGDVLLIEQENLSLSPSSILRTDLFTFQEHLSACESHEHPAGTVCSECLPLLAEAASLYKNDFLFGFSLRDSTEFDLWQFAQSERLRGELSSVLNRLVYAFTDRERFDEAIRYARRWLALDPMNEAAHRALMDLFARCGQIAAAVRQYQECVRVLNSELDVEPEEETERLMHAIRERRSPAPETPETQQEVVGTPLVEDEIRIVTALQVGLSPSGDKRWDRQLEKTADLIVPLIEEIKETLLRYEAQVQTLFAEDLLAVFGASRSHEDDAERAILAALEIQRLCEQHSFSISTGINTGSAYVGPAGAQRQLELVVMGPVVNRAARLRYKAGAGQILVGQPTYRLTRGLFDFESQTLDLVDVAEKGEPLPVYRVTAHRRIPVKSYGIEGLRAELIGREAQLNQLEKTLDELRQGRGRFVALIGEAGIGKSRLIGELKRELETAAKGPVWMEGRCTELSMSTSYGPFLELFRQLFGWHPHDGEHVRANRIVRLLTELEESGFISAEQIKELGPILGNLFSIRFGNQWDEVLSSADPQQIRHRSFQAIRALFVALSRKQPLLLVFEDMHWADSLSLDLIGLLMEATSKSLLLLLCVYRPDKEHRCRNLPAVALKRCPGNCLEIHLHELSRQESDRLIESLLEREELPGSLKDTIFERSLGNPLFQEEVIRSLIDEGFLYRKGDVWRSRSGTETTKVPQGVQSVIQGRVDRLSPPLKQILQQIAVLGQVFTGRIIEETTPGKRDPENLLKQLEERALIFEERSFPEKEYAFRHVLVQESVYQSIPWKRRLELHRRGAEAVEALYAEHLDAHFEQIAYHYDRSDRTEKAIEYLLKSGEKARLSHSNEEACRYFERALERCDETEVGKLREECKLQALEGLAGIHLLIWKLDEAEHYFKRAIDLAKEIGLNATELVRLYSWLGDSYFWQNRFDEMIQLGKEGLALLGEETESLETAAMNLTIARAHGCKIENQEYRRYVYRTMPYIRRLHYSEELLTALLHMAFVHLDRKEVEEATKWFEYIERKASEQQELRVLARLHGTIGHHLLRQIGDHHGAIRKHQEALALNEKIGSAWAVYYLYHLGRNHEFLGRLPEAVQYYQKSQNLVDRSVVRFWAPALKNMSVALLCMGRREEALEILPRADRFYRETVMEFDPGRGRNQVGWALMAAGKAQEAAGFFKEALYLWKRPIIDPTHDQVQYFIYALAGLEEALDDPDKFRTYCLRFLQEHPEAMNTPFQQWYLESARPAPFSGEVVTDMFREALSGEWTWQDPFGTSSYRVEKGLEIRAANGGNLWKINVNAPRVIRRARGSFAAQTVCLTALKDRPAIGGIVLWKDRKNYFTLVKGARGRNEISFRGCRDAEDIWAGRGRLVADRIHLRLERMGSTLRAFCSGDGRSWFTVGQAELPVQDPVELGLFGGGWIWRPIYPGAFPDGAAIRFESFQMQKL